MKITRAASIPLIMHDPYFSIWSSSDHLYDADTVHWTGKRQQIRGYLTVDKTVYCFMGDKEFHQILPQISLDVTATATTYTFENDKVRLCCRFTSPLILSDPLLVSRPCTYIDFMVEKKNADNVKLDFIVSADLVRQEKDEVAGFAGTFKQDFSYASMGRMRQQPLGSSGDHTTIDWGYVYLAGNDKSTITYDAANEAIRCQAADLNGQTTLILAYDDLASINYFGEWRKAYWTTRYKTILEAISAAFADQKKVCKQASEIDCEIEAKAKKIGGDEYSFLCAMSYRHAIAAHKLITDEDKNLIFLSKENDSNGCIGTVDVSYPSVPLFMLYNTEYVKGMLRPIFRFADCDVWTYDFAPHDVGRYPYAWGQVYGRSDEENKRFRSENQFVYPPYYMYPSGSNVYGLRDQMPVEECGNMLIMTAMVCRMEKNASFALPYMETLKTWREYLIRYGADPGEQLCTDDFAGHLSHNTNLSVKAIMGIEGYAQIAALAGEKNEAKKYHKIAADMASDWEKRAKADDHYQLVFGEGKKDTWSLKYNLVWDKLWKSGLFSDEVYEKELAYYKKKANRYGTPLDSRAAYTKSDWILWCAAMDDNTAALIQPVAAYLKETTTRVPFSDWYQTDSGRYCYFIARSVQGGIFMPMLVEQIK
ncbi:DUF4965 domain-containing protein [Lachnoclostridium sp. 210928-DFI.6.3]|nr:DUF4965 domain-containing protein [Lachnoclostridium sp. 210928-DFI.6.3]